MTRQRVHPNQYRLTEILKFLRGLVSLVNFVAKGRHHFIFGVAEGTTFAKWEQTKPSEMKTKVVLPRLIWEIVYNKISL